MWQERARKEEEGGSIYAVPSIAFSSKTEGNDTYIRGANLHHNKLNNGAPKLKNTCIFLFPLLGGFQSKAPGSNSRYHMGHNF